MCSGPRVSASALRPMTCSVVFSASQLLEKSHDDTVNSLCGAWNISQDTLCSGKVTFFSVIDLNFENIMVFLFGVSSNVMNS